MVRVKMVADDVQSFDPVIHTPEICGVDPLFPKTRGVPPGIEFRRPLQKPQDVNSFPGIFHRPLCDGFEGQRTDLNLNGNRHAVYVRAHVRAVGSERTFQRDVVDVWFFLECLENLHFAAPVCLALILRILARKGIDVGEMVHRASAGLQNDFIAAIRTFERAVCFRG